MIIENKTAMSNAELSAIVAKAIIAKAAKAHCYSSDECTVSVENSIHFTKVYTCVVVYIDGHRVQFSRFRLHDPCRSHYFHEVDKPFGGECGGIRIEAEDGFGITVHY